MVPALWPREGGELAIRITTSEANMGWSPNMVRFARQFVLRLILYSMNQWQQRENTGVGEISLRSVEKVKFECSMIICSREAETLFVSRALSSSCTLPRSLESFFLCTYLLFAKLDKYLFIC